jgi:hypothetical protein
MWGPALTFSARTAERHDFKPSVPGLYVIRHKLTSTTDGTTAGTNAILFVTGNRD